MLTCCERCLNEATKRDNPFKPDPGIEALIGVKTLFCPSSFPMHHMRILARLARCFEISKE